MKELIRIKCLKHLYPDKTEVSLCGLDFVIRAKERIAVLGPNGVGKTTLLNHILGILKPVEGEVKVFDLDPFKFQREVVKKIGVVFQNVDEQIIGPTVYDDIAFAPRNYGYSEAEIEQLVQEISNSLCITNLLTKIPHYLSGGQKKKVALAGAMVLKPEILILDEPFNGLDPMAKEELIHLLNDINTRYGTALLITSHDIDYLPHLVDKVYILYSGKLLRYGDIGDVFLEKDFLTKVSLRPPILVELFSRLQKRGISVNIPLNIDDAEKEILQLLSASKLNFKS